MAKVYPAGRLWQANPFTNLVPLFTDAAWNKHANTTTSTDGKTLTANAVGVSELSRIDISVIKGAPYQAVLVITGSCQVEVGSLRSPVAWEEQTYLNTNASGTIVVPLTAKSGTIRVNILSRAAGTYTVASVTLVRVQPTPVAANFQEFFKELVVNGDFSQGTTGWTVAPQASVVNGQLVLNATAAWQSSWSAPTPVAPFTNYRVSFEGTGRLIVYDGAVQVPLMSNSPAGVYQFNSGVFKSVSMLLGNVAPGTFTFDNISLKRAIPT